MSTSKTPLERRERISLGVVLVIFAALIAGLIWRQIIEHGKYDRLSDENRIRVVPIIPPRGKVYDRYRRPIIDNTPSYTLVVYPVEVKEGVTMANLASVPGLDTVAISRRINKTMINRYLPVPVKRGISDTMIAILEEQAENFPGVKYRWEQARHYLAGAMTESFTGYVVEASREDTSGQKRTDYRELGVDIRLLGRLVGKSGIEKQYDAELRGNEGLVYHEVTATGRHEEQNKEKAVSGSELILTIDPDLQKACAGALDSFCCGAIVALDPRDGGILAMASYPSYNANKFSSVLPEDAWRDIIQDSTHPLLNRLLNGLYPPGSTVKLVTLGAALEDGHIHENSTLKPCTGGYRFGNRVFHCWEESGHGFLIPVQAIERSCDIYMYQLGLSLGVDRLAHYFSECGFGKPTGIDLPGESSGLVPDTRYYNDRYGKRGWTRALVLNNSIGQGELLATPLQLALFFCALANPDGIAYTPHLVHSKCMPDGTIIETPRVQKLKLPFSPKTHAILREGLRLAVEGENGTARRLKNNRYTIAGKTGTAENPHGENHSWFVGFATFDKPEIVVAVLVENAGHGTDVAAPIAGRIINKYLAKRHGSGALTTTDDKTEP
ncbi:MAG: penicillin-binding protein 2 [Candidatus Zixiibacteriota bacterium]